MWFYLIFLLFYGLESSYVQAVSDDKDDKLKKNNNNTVKNNNVFREEVASSINESEINENINNNIFNIESSISIALYPNIAIKNKNFVPNNNWYNVIQEPLLLDIINFKVNCYYSNSINISGIVTDQIIILRNLDEVNIGNLYAYSDFFYQENYLSFFGGRKLFYLGYSKNISIINDFINGNNLKRRLLWGDATRLPGKMVFGAELINYNVSNLLMYSVSKPKLTGPYSYKLYDDESIYYLSSFVTNYFDALFLCAYEQAVQLGGGMRFHYKENISVYGELVVDKVAKDKKNTNITNLLINARDEIDDKQMVDLLLSAELSFDVMYLSISYLFHGFGDSKEMSANKKKINLDHGIDDAEMLEYYSYYNKVIDSFINRTYLMFNFRNILNYQDISVASDIYNIMNVDDKSGLLKYKLSFTYDAYNISEIFLGMNYAYGPKYNSEFNAFPSSVFLSLGLKIDY